MLGKQFVQQLDKALHLTPEQRAAIAKIVTDGQERNREIWTNVAPQMHKVLQDVRQQIREQLTPEQRKQFEELLKRFRPAGHRPQPPANSPSPTNEPPMMAPPTRHRAFDFYFPFSSAPIFLRNSPVTESMERLASTMLKS